MIHFAHEYVLYMYYFCNSSTTDDQAKLTEDFVFDSIWQ